MGLEARHAYRFGYLQSEHWKSLRLQKLAEANACCYFCNHRDISNDVHHVYYPDNIYDTKTDDLRVLCREHHERLHSLMEIHKSSFENEAKTKQGGGFRLFRICSLVIEKEMRAQGKLCMVFNSRREAGELKLFTIDRRNVMTNRLVRMKEELDRMIQDEYSIFPDSIRSKAQFLADGIRMLADDMPRAIREEEQKLNQGRMREFIADNHVDLMRAGYIGD